MSDAQDLEHVHVFFPLVLVMVPLMVIASTVMSLAAA
jgi:hypothetical protein